MKSPLTIIIAFFAFVTQAQIATLKVENPAPRISDGVEVSVLFEKKKIEKKGRFISPAEMDNKLGDAQIDFWSELLDTGFVEIGPFDFKIGDTKFTTDKLTIKVYPDLPNVTDGVWIRLVKYKGEDLILLEQRSSHDWQLKSGDHPIRDIDGERVVFAELNKYKFEELGIELIEDGAKTSSGMGNNPLNTSGVVSYKFTKYKIRKLATFKNKVTITKELFTDFPGDIDLPRLEIK